MTINVALVTLGCAKNLVDSEVMLNKIMGHGFVTTSDYSKAQVLVVNTCGFIASAKEESINTILDLAQYKEKGLCELLVVVGCLVQKYQVQLAQELPEVDIWLGTDQVEQIGASIGIGLSGEKLVVVNDQPAYVYDFVSRVSSTPKFTAYIKIAEGCDNCCSYCAIPQMRGPYRSRNMEAILTEARELVAAGSVELILIAQDTTLYGFDLYGEYKLTELVKQLLEIEGIKWIRLLYCYPAHFDPKLIQLMKEEERICNYLDIPLQHGDNYILKNMNRKSSQEQVVELLRTFKEQIPDIALRTTFIVGFPGESEANFNNLLNFMLEHRFHWVGVFPYSREDGTPAYDMDDQLPQEVKEYRADKLMKLQQEITREINFTYIGKKVKVLVEGISPESSALFYGRTQFQAPEVDGTTLFTAAISPEIGSFVTVIISHVDDYDLIGEMVP